jgi:hypothetical protein
MTGYQEILTDPSYAGQIITFTFPHIGNVGTNDEDVESRPPTCRGVVGRKGHRISDPAVRPLHRAAPRRPQMCDVVTAVCGEGKAPLGAPWSQIRLTRRRVSTPAIPMRLRSFSHWSRGPRARQLAGE